MVSISKLQTAIERVLAEESYKHNAKRIQQAIAQAGGVKRAADIIEVAIGIKVDRSQSCAVN
jgi:zeaxanthin glucosyltransferase